MNKRWLALLLLFCVFIGGCVQRKIIEDILLVQAEGFDLAGENMIKGTYGFAKYKSTASRNPESKIIQGTARTTKMIDSKINKKSAMPVELGQLRVVMFGKKLAQKGLSNMVDTLIRDPQIGTNIYLGVSTGKSERLLKQTFNGVLTAPSMYISRLIEQNVRTESLTTTNLHVFAYHLYDPSCDSVLPLIGLESRHAVIEGLALFDNGQYVAKINADDLFIFKRLYEDSNSGIYQIKVHHDGQESIAVVRQMRSTQSYDVKHSKIAPIVTLKVKLNGMVAENLDGLNLKKKKSISLLERAVEKEFQRRAERMVKRFQSLGIDPLCIGSHVRANDRNWSPKKWESLYPKTKVKVKVKVNIEQTGTIE